MHPSLFPLIKYRAELGQEESFDALGRNGGARDFDGQLQNPPELHGVEDESDLTWAAVHNLDLFFTRLYRYWEEKGFFVVLSARLLNLAALAFTILSSGFLLLGFDYSALNADCLKKDECGLWDVAVLQHPLAGGPTWWVAASLGYLAIFASYWTFAAAHLVREVRGLAEVRHFFSVHLGMTDAAVRNARWPEIAARVVAAQRSVRLCIARDLDEHDIVSRIMRRENYLIGMLNRGVIPLHLPLPGLRGHLILTKTVEWNLYWGLLDPMFDDATFTVRQDFLLDEGALRRRFRTLALVNAIISPFLLVFLVIYFFMKNAEALYHHPSTIGARRWSPLAYWKLREFNELPYFVSQRLSSGHAAAERYVAQFPSYAASHVARFVAFVAGSFAALLIALTLVDERILERDLAGGRQTVWWLALLGVILAGARALIVEQSTTAFDPGLSLLEVGAHTHYYPRHWRGRAHTLEVQTEFKVLFRYRASLFLEELASVVLTPILLWCSLPPSARAIVDFVRTHTTRVAGVGDVCSLAAFDVRRHGDPSYGSPWRNTPQSERAREGKLEKSIASFAATYPSWHPDEDAAALLSHLVAGGQNAFIEGSSLKVNRLGLGEASSGHVQPGHPYGMLSMMGASQHPMLGLLVSQYPGIARLYCQQYNRRPRGSLPPRVDGRNFGYGINENENSNGGRQGSVFPGVSPQAPEEERVAVAHAAVESFHADQDERGVVGPSNGLYSSAAADTSPRPRMVVGGVGQEQASELSVLRHGAL